MISVFSSPDRTRLAPGCSARARNRRPTVASALACVLLLAGCSSDKDKAASTTTKAASAPSGQSGQSGPSGSTAQSDCALDPVKRVATPVRIAAPNAPGAMTLVRANGGLDAGFGVAPDWKALDTQGALSGVQDGSVDFAVVDSYAFARFLTTLSAPPPVTVWVMDILNTDGALVSKTVSTAAGLADHKVAGPKASVEGYSLGSALARAGVNIAGIDWHDVPIDQALAETLAGQADGTFVVGATHTAAVSAGATVLETSGALARKGAPVFNFLISSPTFLSAHPEVTDFVLCTVNNAVNSIVADPVSAGATMAASVGLDAATVTDRLRGYQYLPAASQVLPEYLDGGLVMNLSSAAQVGNFLGLNPVAPSDDVLKAAMSVEPARRVVAKS